MSHPYTNPGEADYTLPGVMRFLQTEWQRHERDHIRWDIERAELSSRLAKLESERHSLQRTVEDHLRTIALLQAGRGTNSKGGDAPHAAANNDVSDPGDFAKLASLRKYMDQCVSDVGQLLEQNGISSEAEPEATPYFDGERQSAGIMRRLMRTLPDIPGGCTSILHIEASVWVIGSGDGKVLQWNSDTGRVLIEHPAHEGAVTALVSLGSQLVASGSEDGQIALWDSSPQGGIHRLGGWKAHTTSVEAIAALSAELLVSASAAGLSLWNLRPLLDSGSDREMIPVVGYKVKQEYPSRLIKVPHEDAFVAGYTDGSIVMFDETLQSIKTFELLSVDFGVLSPAVSALDIVGDSLFVGYGSGNINEFSIKSGKWQGEFIENKRAVTSISHSPDENVAVSTSADGRVYVWTLRLESLTWKCRLLSHDALETRGALCSAWSINQVIVGGADGLVRVYDMTAL